MADKLDTAEKNEAVEETTEVNEDAVVDQEEESEVEFTDTDKRDDDAEGKPKQSAEQNSENARRRREAERQKEIASAREEARNQAVIEAMGGKNPFTGEEMKDSEDVKEYLTMKKIEAEGGDPIADYRKWHKQQAKDQTKKQKEAEDKDEWIDKDKQAFAAEHPDVKLSELIADESFRIYAEGKVGSVPLSEIYKGYKAMAEKFGKKAEDELVRKTANQKASAGSLSSPGTAGGFFTREQVQKMSPSEVKKNYDKIIESQAKWT